MPEGDDVADDSGSDGSRDDLTHVEDGAASMVDVGDKPESARRAVARGRLALSPASVAAIRADDVEKGDVLATARIGAIQAVKHTWETIPLCHQIPITNVDTEFALDDDALSLTVAVETTGQTGCEMEALEGVTTGLNVVFDMVKAVEKDGDGGYPTAAIEDVRVVEKTKRSLED
ncbi:cyclic pyranopterin monophosphate synthase MoaC [Halorubellus litoreus]|uniref:Cyclic pyranopterin monophosphate synthase MoaC n=1 Tax=Halorubellus litoreus TaxID=755308 RepID=A0ABD5VF05_9EURY